MGLFDRIFAWLAGKGPKPDRIMIDATHLKAHRTAASLLKKGMLPVDRANEGRAELQAGPFRQVGHNDHANRIVRRICRQWRPVRRSPIAARPCLPSRCLCR